MLSLNINYPINSNVNNFFEVAYKIRLLKDSKNPTKDWSSKDEFKFRWKKTYTVGVCNNLGLPCGTLNDVVVVDIDFYKLEENIKCEFLERFYDNDVMNHKGIVQKTPSGGYHLFFRYRNGILNHTSLGKYKHIDIRANGGYIVISPSVIDGKKYEVLKNEPLEQMSDDMFNFIQAMIEKRKQKNAKKEQKKKSMSDHKKEYLSVESETGYHITEDEFIKIVEKLPEDTFTDYNKWFSFTTMCKILNFEKVWDDTNKTKPKYNEKNNQKTWNAVDTKYEGHIDHLLGKKAKLFKDMYKYKKEPANTIEAKETFNRNKIGYDYLQDAGDYIIKSDTGTGKTTAFKSYVDRSDGRPFLSIVSRISLADSQHDSFIKNCGNRIIHHYKHKIVEIDEKNKERLIDFDYYHYNELDSVIITIDSLSKFKNPEIFKNHIIFLDEVNSMIEYLITCPTLKNKRVITYQFLIGVLKNCHQIIAVDADISDLTHNFLKQSNRTFKFVENTFIHNQGIQSTELHNEHEMIEKLKKEDKFMLCMDSAIEAERIHRALNDPSIKLITRLSIEEDDEKRRQCKKCKGKKDVDCDECCKIIPYHEMDRYDKIIFSPKIVYGIDSLMKRPVYAYYKEHTISPRGMIQQICRNRNITEVFYLFTKQSYKYNDMTFEAVKEEVKLLDLYSYKHFKILEQFMTDDKIKNDFLAKVNDKYLQMITHIIHTNNCLNTNKRVHFRLLLEKRGFIDSSKNIKTQKITLTKEEKQALKEEKLEKFDSKSERVQKINEYLQIPPELINDYADLIDDQNKLDDHFNWRKFAHHQGDETLEESLDNELKVKNEFNVQKTTTKVYKLKYLAKFRKAIGLKNSSLPDFHDIEIKHPIDEKEVDKLQKEYCMVFKTRAKDIDFKKNSCINKHMMLMHKHLFGENIINTEIIGKYKVGNKRSNLYKYTINLDTTSYHHTLIDFSRGRPEPEEDTEYNKQYNVEHDELIEEICKEFQ